MPDYVHLQLLSVLATVHSLYQEAVGASGFCPPAAGASSAQTKSGVGVNDMFRSSRPSILPSNRQARCPVWLGTAAASASAELTLASSGRQPTASQSHSERKGEARPRLVKVLDVEEARKLNRQPSPEQSQSAAPDR